MGEAQLYLIAEVDGAGPAEAAAAAAKARLTAALDAAPIASVLLVAADGGSLPPALAKSLIELLQKRGSAALLADDAGLVRTLRADGVHLNWSKEQPKRYREARDMLGERFIVGADAGRSKDDAMTLGEEGADYIAFGIPAHVEDRDTASARQRDLVSWWSEIFEPPCVAFDVADEVAARGLAAAGADFIAVTLSVDLSPADVTGRIAAFASSVEDRKITA